jgi:Transposase DDE domain/Domain of unknown function (DUF4372)
MEISAMPHQNTVFRDVLKLLPWSRFERLVEEYDADARVRRLTSKDQLVALLYGQFSGASSLREIVAEVFSGLLEILMKQAHRGLRHKLAETVYLIDSTSVRLNERSADWARFSAGVCGTKMHVIYDADADQPIYASVSAANVNDITAAKQMPIEPGATYVFDLGYYDYGWWAELDEACCRIVTRFKSNTPLRVIQELKVRKGANILSDRIGYLPARLAKSRQNPMPSAVREVMITIETGKVLRILTNDLDADAEHIADLYRRRWAIELFFRWVKQTLKITRFIGTSENAVRIQIAVALIAFLLLRLAQRTQKAIKSPLVFTRLVRTQLMQRRSIHSLLAPPTCSQDERQISLALC